MEFLGKSKNYTKELLDKLENNGLLRWESKQISKTKLHKIWKVF